MTCHDDVPPLILAKMFYHASPTSVCYNDTMNKNSIIVSGMKILYCWLLLCGCLIFISGCEPTAQMVIPTSLPTITPTFTPSPTWTPARDITPTQRPTLKPTAGPSPTPLFGATRTPIPVNFITPTRILNPNAPRIEFFTSDVLATAPGGTVTLYWSVRNVVNAVIYRLNRQGERTQAYNVPADGNLAISTRSTDRGQLDFILTAGEGANTVEQLLTIPLQCPIAWFFSPSPEDCPDAEPENTPLVEQPFERGRMVFAVNRNLIYVLFNDGRSPAWLTFENRYDPAVHPERDENAPPEFIQPLRELGLVWRGNDTVRSRLGLGTAEATRFDGFIQVLTLVSGAEELYISSADGTVLQLLLDGELWQLIAPQQ